MNRKEEMEVSDEMLVAAMRAFEPMSSVLRYREKDKWHTCDMMAMRDAIRAVLALRASAASEEGQRSGHPGTVEAAFMRWLPDHLMPTEFSHLYLFKKDEDGDYEHHFVQHMWEGWRAASKLSDHQSDNSEPQEAVVNVLPSDSGKASIAPTCTCGQAGHGNAHEPGCPLSSYAGPTKYPRQTAIRALSPSPSVGTPAQTSGGNDAS